MIANQNSHMFMEHCLVVSTPLKNISQLGWLFPIYGKIENIPNHQPEHHWWKYVEIHDSWISMISNCRCLIEIPIWLTLCNGNKLVHLVDYSLVRYIQFTSIYPLVTWHSSRKSQFSREHPLWMTIFNSYVSHYQRIPIEHGSNYKVIGDMGHVSQFYRSGLPRPLLLIGSCNPHDLDEKVTRAVPTSTKLIQTAFSEASTEDNSFQT